jgi:hypothetical protein
MAADGSLSSPSFAECLTLGKHVFAECGTVPSVLHSINQLVTESRTLPSAALGKAFFAECPTKGTRQRVRHSAKSRIPVVIGTRDLVQEHVAFRVWPLVEGWEMPKETITDSNEGGLVRLKYTFRFGDKFDEPNDDWLKCIETTSDELLGAYSKTEDNALSVAFEGRSKKRLNRVFDAIGFVYPDYCYPLRGQVVKRKIVVSGKVAASAITAEPKGKKMKVLTHRSRYIEPAAIPEFGEGATSAAETKETVSSV